MTEIYPDYPGSKGIETSAEAADAIAPSASRLRDRCVNIIKQYGDLSADQVAAYLGESILAIRPRIAELHRMGLIEDTGIRTINKSGRSAAIWKVVINEPIKTTTTTQTELF